MGISKFFQFFLVVLANFKGLEVKKFGERPFRVSPNFFAPPRIAIAPREGPQIALDDARLNDGAVNERLYVEQQDYMQPHFSEILNI
jgi:hypothetical protein